MKLPQAARPIFLQPVSSRRPSFSVSRRRKSLRRLTEERLLRKIGIPEENCFWLTEENAGRCDEAIRRCGGLDLAVLGLGVNAHIGYNEPGTQFSTGCRVQKLTGKTKQQLAWLFPDGASVPEKAVTMGIRTLTQAKEILVLAVGEEKAKAVFDMLYARDDSVIPAAFLQIPANVTVCADPAAEADCKQSRLFRKKENTWESISVRTDSGERPTRT